MRELHASLEHISVIARVFACRVGLFDPDQVAQTGDEQLVVGPLGAGCLAPFGDELGRCENGGHERMLARHSWMRLDFGIVIQVIWLAGFGRRRPRFASILRARFIGSR